ncbi:hypothetical protein PIB30_099327 [Stylosanthes scabra]|uniref:F-box domain-containing protein n=1 Tax=Stylosanthes scabra TaxID=79078 RepID=A0ABU6RX33_9FABA|nr:hypothetical protein [Stylosanthes scabra]
MDYKFIIAELRELPQLRKRTVTKQELKNQTNWSDLPADLTLMIIAKLSTFDILTSVQQVCRQWRIICKDSSLWHTINMSDVGIPKFVDYNLGMICRHAVYRGCFHLVELSIEYFGTNDLLKFIIDSNCPLLKSLKFNQEQLCYRTVNNSDAYAIAQNMCNLTHLQIVGNRLDNNGLRAILDGCPRLESLDLRECKYVKLEKLEVRCDELIKNVKEPNAPLDGYRFGGLHCHDYEKACNEAIKDYRSNKKLLQVMEKLKKKKLRRLEARVLENEERFAKSSKGELSRNSGFKSENGYADWEDIYAIWENRKSQRSRRGFQRPLKEKKVKSKGEKNKRGRKAGKINQHKSISFYVEEYEQQLWWREDDYYFESFLLDKDQCLCRDCNISYVNGGLSLLCLFF